MRIKTWYFIDSWTVIQGDRRIDYCYLDDEVIYHYKGVQKKEFYLPSPFKWGKKLRKYNIKPSKEMKNG